MNELGGEIIGSRKSSAISSSVPEGDESFLSILFQHTLKYLNIKSIVPFLPVIVDRHSPTISNIFQVEALLISSKAKLPIISNKSHHSLITKLYS